MSLWQDPGCHETTFKMPVLCHTVAPRQREASRCHRASVPARPGFLSHPLPSCLVVMSITFQKGIFVEISTTHAYEAGSHVSQDVPELSMQPRMTLTLKTSTVTSKCWDSRCHHHVEMPGSVLHISPTSLESWMCVCVYFIFCIF